MYKTCKLAFTKKKKNMLQLVDLDLYPQLSTQA